MKIIILISLLAITEVLYGQKSSPVSFSGGLWTGFNKSTTFVGFVGPKISTTFSVGPKTKLEFGINGIPGSTLGATPKFGLAIGNTITLRRDNWKIKPIIGVAMLKTETWQTIYGIGFLF